jgi:rhamnosyltransferase
MDSTQMTKVDAVIVTFLPDGVCLSELLVALSNQVARIHVIDNTPASDVRVASIVDGLHIGNVGLRRLGDNYGIAKALNVGIELARTSGATHVLLSDQDSLPAADMVEGLLRTQRDLVEQGARVGAVAPTFTDQNTGITFPFQAELTGKFFYGHVRPDISHPVTEALTLITSGTLVPVEVFADAGIMREDLFIDHVDIEWSHRVRSRGWKLYGPATQPCSIEWAMITCASGISVGGARAPTARCGCTTAFETSSPSASCATSIGAGSCETDGTGWASSTATWCSGHRS